MRQVLADEVDLRARGAEFIPSAQEGPDAPSVKYRETLNANGAPSEEVARGYRWMPGTELAGMPMANLHGTEATA